MGTVLAFPLARRRRFIRRQVDYMAKLSQHGVERQLACQIDVQRRTLLRKGVDPACVDRECETLAAAIRAELMGYSRGGVRR